MKLYQKGSPVGVLASLFTRSGMHPDQAPADAAPHQPPLPRDPALPLSGQAETAVSLFQLDQNVGFDDAGSGAKIDDQAMNDLFAAIRDTEGHAVLQDAQSTWRSLYSAHGAPVEPDGSDDEPAVMPEDADVRSDTMMPGSDAEAAADETDAELAEAEAATDESGAMPAEADEANDETGAMPGKTEAATAEAGAALDDADAEAVEADPAPAEAEADASGDEADAVAADAAAILDAPPEPAMAADGVEVVEVVEVADFDPERDVIGVFYPKTIDAVTGKPITPKVRISGDADGAGHIISLDGCDVARVIGAKHLAEDQIELIGE